jgi:hypothetical protein
MTWITALKEYNQGKAWSVPRKGSAEYTAVMLILSKMPKKLKEPKEPKEKKVAKLDVPPLALPVVPIAPAVTTVASSVESKVVLKERIKSKKPEPISIPPLIPELSEHLKTRPKLLKKNQIVI